MSNDIDTGKVSLSFSVDHEVGSLHKVLAVLAAYNVNLTKIQIDTYYRKTLGIYVLC